MPRYPSKPRARESDPWLNGDAATLYNHYYNRLAGVAATRYRWEGLPDNIDGMRLEQALIMQGGLAAFYHQRPTDTLGDGEQEAKNGRFTVARASYGGAGLDDLFMPAVYRTISPGTTGARIDTTRPLHRWRGVPIWGDSLRQNYDGATIELFAKRLARAALIVDTNMASTTRGVIVLTEQDDLLTNQMTLDTVLSGVPAFVNKNVTGIENFKTLDLGVHPETVERSHVVAMRLWNEALTALGVQAGAQEKDERLTDDEVQAIKGAVESVRRRTLTPRQNAATLINRRYFNGADVVRVVDEW